MVKAFGWVVKISYKIGNLQEKYSWIEKKFNFRHAESAIFVGPLDGVAQWAMNILVWSSGRESQRHRNWSDKDEGLSSDSEWDFLERECEMEREDLE